jgi:hypothetical protein
MQRHIESMMQFRSPAAAIVALLTVAAWAQEAPVLHPKADVFRHRDRAYIMAPARPIPSFDLVVSVQRSYRPSEWLMIEHRKRLPVDSTARFQEQDPPATTYSFYHPERNQIRPLPAGAPPGSKAIIGAVGDVVLIGQGWYASEAEEDVTSRTSFALHIPTGRTLNMPEDANIRVIDEQRFLVDSEDKYWLLNWEGERKNVPVEGNPGLILNTTNPAQFVYAIRLSNETIQSYLLDVNTGKSIPISDEEMEAAIQDDPPSLEVYQEPQAGRPGTFTAWLGHGRQVSPEEDNLKAELSLADPNLSEMRADGRLPHELDSRGYIASELVDEGAPSPAGIALNRHAEPGVAWFIRDGLLFVRQVETMTLEEYEAYVVRLVQIEAMNIAKWAGVALNIYTADHDDKFPDNVGWRDALRPYLQDENALRRMEYLGNGQRSTEIEDPSDGVMGYVDTPYGRATVAWDSRVRWVPTAAP